MRICKLNKKKTCGTMKEGAQLYIPKVFGKSLRKITNENSGQKRMCRLQTGEHFSNSKYGNSEPARCVVGAPQVAQGRRESSAALTYNKSSLLSSSTPFLLICYYISTTCSNTVGCHHTHKIPTSTPAPVLGLQAQPQTQVWKDIQIRLEEQEFFYSGVIFTGIFTFF